MNMLFAVFVGGVILAGVALSTFKDVRAMYALPEKDRRQAIIIVVGIGLAFVATVVALHYLRSRP